jgi:hypothetical protein
VWDLGGQTSIRYANVINVDIASDGAIPGYLHKNIYLIVDILIKSQLLTMNISSFQRDFGKCSI